MNFDDKMLFKHLAAQTLRGQVLSKRFKLVSAGHSSVSKQFAWPPALSEGQISKFQKQQADIRFLYAAIKPNS